MKIIELINRKCNELENNNKILTTIDFIRISFLLLLGSLILSMLVLNYFVEGNYYNGEIITNLHLFLFCAVIFLLSPLKSILFLIAVIQLAIINSSPEVGVMFSIPSAIFSGLAYLGLILRDISEKRWGKKLEFSLLANGFANTILFLYIWEIVRTAFAGSIIFLLLIVFIWFAIKVNNKIRIK